MNWRDRLHPLNDISTDTHTPPAFIAAQSLRRSMHNSLDYPGNATARIQQYRYPDITPVSSSLSPDAAWKRAREISLQQGWEIHYEDMQSGHMEAVATTPLFRFRDDIVIRVQPEGDGSRVDIRSCSRLGRSDLGANARRIRAFMTAFKAEL